MNFRHFAGPSVCGDSIDIDVKHNHLVTGSWSPQIGH